VFFDCGDPGDISLYSLKALNDSTVYTVELTGYIPLLKAFKSVNSCNTFIAQMSIAGHYFLGQYLLTPFTGFIVSESNWNTTTLRVSRIPSGNSYYYNDIDFDQDKIFYFPIFGDPLCDLDSISFSISKNGSIIRHTIVRDSIWLDKEEVQINKQWQIYPNPAIQYFSFSASRLPDINSQIDIYNFSGMFVKSFAINNENNYSIRELPVGLYFVCIKSDQQNYYLKLIKQ
jgi:hypothetical protein